MDVSKWNLFDLIILYNHKLRMLMILGRKYGTLWNIVNDFRAISFGGS